MQEEKIIDEQIASLPAIVAAEKFHGKFQAAQGFEFKDGRTLTLFAFEKSYLIRCFNPNAPDSEDWKKQANFNLTPESFYGLMQIYSAGQILRHEADRKAFVDQLTPKSLAAIEEIEKLMQQILDDARAAESEAR